MHTRIQHYLIHSGDKHDVWRSDIHAKENNGIVRTLAICIGYFQAIKTDVLLIFSFFTGDKTEFLSPMVFSNELHNWNLTFRILSDQFLAFVY